jgi:hypothetical protein
MKRGLVVLMFVTSFSAHAGWFSNSPAPEAKPAPVKKNPEIAMETSKSQNLSTTESSQPAHSTILRVAPTYSLLVAPPGSDTDTDSIGGVGVGIDLLFHTSAHTKMGLETGFVSYSNDSETATGIPLMFSLLYDFNPGQTGMYLGFSGGFMIFQGEETKSTYNYSTRKYDTTKQTRMIPLPTVAFRPGVNFQLSKGVSAFVETKLGVMLIIPFIAPQAGIAIGL